MLDAVIDYLPAPTDVAEIKGLMKDGEEVALEVKDKRNLPR